MYYKFTKFAKVIIVFVLILTLTMGVVHIYNINRINESHKIIKAYIAEHNVLRESAIRALKSEGVDIYVGQEFFAYFGITMLFMSLFSLYKYATQGSFFWGMFAGLCNLFLTFFGGLILYYLLFSDKAEILIMKRNVDINPENLSDMHKWMHSRSQQ